MKSHLICGCWYVLCQHLSHIVPDPVPCCTLPQWSLSLPQVARRAQCSARPSCQCGAMTTVTEHTSNLSHHPSSALATQKEAKMPARFVVLKHNFSVLRRQKSFNHPHNNICRLQTWSTPLCNFLHSLSLHMSVCKCSLHLNFNMLNLLREQFDRSTTPVCSGCIILIAFHVLVYVSEIQIWRTLVEELLPFSQLETVHFILQVTPGGLLSSWKCNSDSGNRN
jgi:hypothetical protein